MTKSAIDRDRRMIAGSLFLAIFIGLMQTRCSAADAPTERGILKGRFLYDAPPPKPKLLDTSKEPLCKPFNLVDESLVVGADGGLKNVLIFVVTKDVASSPVKQKPGDPTKRDVVMLRMKEGRFEPRILPMLVTQTLEVHDEDTSRHNAKITEPSSRHVSPNLAAGPIWRYKYAAPSSRLFPVECSIHPWMKAYVVPRDNPYFAVSADDGAFEIKDLPVGKTLEFQVLHERAGNFKLFARPGWTKGRFSFEIKPGENDLGEIKFDPKLFDREAPAASKQPSSLSSAPTKK